MPTPDVDALQPLVDWGGWLGFIAVVVLAMIRGWLLPGRQVDRLIAVYDKIIGDKDQQIADWRETARTEAARGDLLAKNQETTIALLRQLVPAHTVGGER